MNKRALVLRYTSFALLAIGSNLILQWITVRMIHGEIAHYAGIAVGTGAGLIIKYILDKKYVFYYQAGSPGRDLGKFILYTAMGIITTLIFWSCELGFYFLFKTEGMKLLGAFIGLVIGYYAKYSLDKEFVFVN